ncbi:MAG: GTP-binding protein [bacterium]
MMTSDALDQMNIVIVGHVDHGKSTLIGRLLADTGSLPQGKLEQVKEQCKRNARPFEYAFLLDALKDERSQGITIDSARCFFKSKKRSYIIIDAPGHIEFLKNMISGAARADAAILVIDAKEGVKENSKRHGYMLAMLGIKQVAVCINKMDLVDYDQRVFQAIKNEYLNFLKQINVTPNTVIPIAAREGQNICKQGDKLSWFQGDSVLDTLDNFKKEASWQEHDFRFPVQDVYKFTANNDERRIVAGRVESGQISVGDEVVFLPSNKRSTIKSIEAFNVQEHPKTISAGRSTGFTLTKQIYVGRGEVMCKAVEKRPYVGSTFRTKIFWMGKEPLIIGKDYKLKVGTSSVLARVKEINYVLDASELNSNVKDRVERHEIAECVIESRRPLAVDLWNEFASTGRYVLVDNYDIAGGGIITEVLEERDEWLKTDFKDIASKWDYSLIKHQERADTYGHKPKLILLTGKVGVDKKSIGKYLEKKMFDLGLKVYFSPMGNILRSLSHKEYEMERIKHFQKIGEVAHLMLNAGLVLIVTASDCTDQELDVLQSTVIRDFIYIINVGEKNIEDNDIDLNLDLGGSIDKNVEKIFTFMQSNGIFLKK